jgi:hypothetical protein
MVSGADISMFAFVLTTPLMITLLSGPIDVMLFVMPMIVSGETMIFEPFTRTRVPLFEKVEFG